MKFWRIFSIFLLMASIGLHIASHFPELEINFYKGSFLLFIALATCFFAAFYYLLKLIIYYKKYGAIPELRWVKFQKWATVFFAGFSFFCFWYAVLDRNIYHGDQIWQEEGGYFYARYPYKPKHPEHMPATLVSRKSYYEINAGLAESQTRGDILMGVMVFFVFFFVLPIKLTAANDQPNSGPIANAPPPLG